MKRIDALHSEVSMSTSASIFGPAVAMAAEASEERPTSMIIHDAIASIAIRRETFATWMFPLVLGVCWGSRVPSLIDSLNPPLRPQARSNPYQCGHVNGVVMRQGIQAIFVCT